MRFLCYDRNNYLDLMFLDIISHKIFLSIIHQKGALTMDEQNVKRTRRTPQQMAEDIDGKIQKLNQDLEALADGAMA